MMRRGDRVLHSEVIPITPRTGKLVFLEFDATGTIRTFSCTEHPPHTQSAAELAAARLVQDTAARMRQAGDLAKAERQLQLMLDLVQNLRALEDQHRQAAHAMLAPSTAATAG